MNTITATLCKKPVIGVAMWLVFLCTGSNAFRDVEVDLSRAGDVLKREISVPMNEKYGLEVRYVFDDWAAYEADGPAGSIKGSHSEACKDGRKYELLTDEERKVIGAELVLNVSIQAIDGASKMNAKLTSRCVQSWGDKSKGRFLGYLDLTKWKYVVTVSNVIATGSLRGGHSTISLSGVGVGFP